MSVRFRIFESLDSSVIMVEVIDFSISRRMVMFVAQRGRRMVVVVCWRRCRIVVIACREWRCVRSGGVLEDSWEAA